MYSHMYDDVSLLLSLSLSFSRYIYIYIYISKGAQRLPATVPQSSSSSDRQCFLEVPLL